VVLLAKYLYMLTLYVLTGCPFCAKVLAAGEELGVEFTLKNVGDEAIAQELIARGGKQQTPYLVDSETNTEMYESDAIIAYLHQRFGKDV
jgi:glutaredoxin 3